MEHSYHYVPHYENWMCDKSLFKKCKNTDLTKDILFDQYFHCLGLGLEGDCLGLGLGLALTVWVLSLLCLKTKTVQDN